MRTIGTPDLIIIAGHGTIASAIGPVFLPREGQARSSRGVVAAELDTWTKQASDVGLALFGGMPLQPRAGFCYRLPEQLLAQNRWQPGADALVSEGLALLHLWRPGSSLPEWPLADASPTIAPLSICWDAKDQSTLRSAVEAWRTEIMPVTARVIATLYWPRRWSLVEKLPKEDHLQQITTAASFSRAWLTFYARPDAPQGPEHVRNQALLWRLYTHALVALTRMGKEWSSDQEQELARAVQQWITYCTETRWTWLFTGGFEERREDDAVALSRRHHTLAREERRELEVARTLSALTAAYATQGSSLRDPDYREAIREILDQSSLGWHLVRYNRAAALRLQWSLAQADMAYRQVSRDKRHPAGVASWHWLRWLIWVFAGERLIAGVTVGFTITVLSEDTWTWLFATANDALRSMLLIVGAALLLLGYLWQGITRRTMVDWSTTLGRALQLWVPSQLGALVLGWIAYSLGTALHPLCSLSAPPPMWLVIALHAQIALSFGFFAQLVFSELPSTTPLGPP